MTYNPPVTHDGDLSSLRDSEPVQFTVLRGVPGDVGDGGVAPEGLLDDHGEVGHPREVLSSQVSMSILVRDHRVNLLLEFCLFGCSV